MWLCVFMSGCGAAAAGDLEYVRPDAVAPGAVVIDTRAEQACARRSVAGAHCLPAADLLGARGELPSPPDLLWALGTAGLSGRETVLVVGDSAEARDFVAGLLYLCGQARVQVLDQALSGALRAGEFPEGAGTGRGMLRTRVFVAPMRDRLWLLHRDLFHALESHAPVVPVDGRDKRVATVPGAIKLPLSILEQGGGNAATVLGAREETSYVAYGQDPRDSIALFARLRALTGQDVRVLAGGWREWAGVSGYPVTTEAAPNDADSATAAADHAARVLGIGILLLVVAMVFAGVNIRRGDRWM
jgi:thiosulfate/3-mercaptopyruvate sulfurtransferase